MKRAAPGVVEVKLKGGGGVGKGKGASRRLEGFGPTLSQPPRALDLNDHDGDAQRRQATSTREKWRRAHKYSDGGTAVLNFPIGKQSSAAHITIS